MLKNLKKYLESEKKDKSIFDIILYGSLLKGKEESNDIDIIIIFIEGLTLKEKLEKIQNIKLRIKEKTNLPIDIKQIELKELFSPAFFARTGILLEGFSIFHKKSFSETLGFKSYTLFSYNLNNLIHTEKVKFNYLMSGRKAKGIIKELEGKRIVNGAVKIPLEKSLIFEDILKKNKISYIKKNILEEA